MNKNEFAKRPPMGWNSFDYYDTTVGEAEVKKNAAYMAKNLKAYGWEYVVVDIQWYAYDTGTQRSEHEYIPFSRLEMDGYARLLPCPQKFPSAVKGEGFAPLAEYIHKLGLKFGIHIMRGIPRVAAENRLPILGTNTTADKIADPYSICNWNPDMYGVRDHADGQSYYDSIVSLYASWGVDFIKCDDICNTQAYPQRPDAGFPEIRMLYRAIQKVERPIVLSLSPGPAILEKATDYMKYANMWRLTGDFWDDWRQLRKMFDYCEKWQYCVKGGCYPDCDMLPLGWLGKGFEEERQTRFSPEEQKTMMTLWCIAHSPLMLGAELTRMDERTLLLLTNADVLKLQDMEYQACQIRKDDREAVWISRHNSTNILYIALFRFDTKAGEIKVTEEELGPYMQERRLSQYEKVFEVWDNRPGRIENGCLTDVVAGHGVSLWRCEG